MNLVGTRIVAGVVALFWLVGFFGLIDLLVVVENDPDWHDSYLLEAGWGALFTFLVAGPQLALAARRSVAPGVVVAELLAVAVAITGAALWSGSLPLLVAAVLVAANALLLGAMSEVRRAFPPLDRALRILVVVGAALGGAFAARVLADHPMAEPDITNGLDHLPMQAALGLAMATVGAVAAAAVGGRVPGWRVPVWTLALAVGWVGGWSIVYPDLAGSMGAGLGVAAVAWAVLFAGVAEWRARRRTPATSGRAAAGH